VSSTNGKVEDDWLLELRDVFSPDLRRQIEAADAESIAQCSQSAESDQETPRASPLLDTEAPQIYSTTLELLRGVVADGKWPATSGARSRVIKSPPGSSSFLVTKKRALTSSFPGHAISSGSFTVINEQIWESNELPLGNSLFPNLTRAVFELEEDIIRQSSPPLPAAEGMNRQSSSSLRRSPSTHCAINRNGTFTLIQCYMIEDDCAHINFQPNSLLMLIPDEAKDKLLA
jgi:hypothetical protein